MFRVTPMFRDPYVSLAEKILSALERAWEKDKIVEYAERFTWDNVAKQIIDIYGNLLKSISMLPQSTQSTQRIRIIFSPQSPQSYFYICVQSSCLSVSC